MNKIRIYFILILFLINCPVYSVAESLTNTPNSIAAPSTSHPLSYIISADSASLIQRSGSEFKLILNHIDENVSYTSMNKNKSSGLMPIINFIKLWDRKKDINVQSDITGVQVNNKTFGHTQFYATALLKNPNYVSDQLIFELIPIKPIIKMQTPRADLKNVTVYINGCDLVDCSHWTNYQKHKGDYLS
jgi:hypothetical protein